MTNSTPKVARAMQHLDDTMIANTSYAPKRRRTPWAALAACLALVIIATSVMPNFFPAAVETVVALDVNPSMEISVDKNEDVIDVIPLNEDARIVIGDMDFDDVDLDVAVNALVGSMLKNGYLTIDRNSILVSVDSRDAAKADALQKKLSRDVEQLLSGSNIQASVMTQSFSKDQAPATDNTAAAISPAKESLVQKIVALNMTDSNGTPYTYERLAPLSVHELKQLVESRAMEVTGVTSSGTASTTNYIGKDAAYQAALTHAGLISEQVSTLKWELDHENGQMVYSLEFYVGNTEYDYDVNAVNGTIVEFEKELDNDPYDSDRDDDWDDKFDDDRDDDWDDKYDDDRDDDWDDKYDDDRDDDWDDKYDDRDDDWDDKYDDDRDDDWDDKYDDRDDDWDDKYDDDRDDDWDDKYDDDDDDVPAVAQADRDAAVETALSEANLSESDVRDLDYETDYENGRQVNEVSFDSNGVEYEVTIDANTGEVLFFDSEKDD